MRGDRASLGRIIQRFEPLLQHVVRRYLGPERFADEGEDLLQTLRLALVKALPSARARDLPSLTAWIKKVVWSRLLDWEKSRNAARRRWPRPMVSLSATNKPEVEALSPTPSGIFMGQEELEKLRAAIEKVPSRYRELLRLLYEKSPTPAEVAQFLGKEPEAARKFVARALTHLRQVFVPN
ncbi:MAG: sigma-70 family RNA polymerase sigma factor [Planctomycetes bacterium]|nr:sigma-70 family RNA polymerase sigma factor [Planctomycetota bacterium]